MNITHIIFALKTGGSETMLVDILNEQVNTQSVSLIIINNLINQTLLEQIDNRIDIIQIGRKEKSRSIIHFIKLNYHLSLINPEVIHCHNHAVIRMIFIRRNAVLTVHDMNIPTENFKYYKTIFAISNAVKFDIEKRSEIRPVLIYNGINIVGVMQKKDYAFDIFRIIQVSRLDHKKKGQHILLKALKILVNDYKIKYIYVDFIGSGNSLSYLKDLVLEYKLKKHVNFKGSCDREFIYNYLKDYNLLVQPSILEGFGLAITEAMAAKVPVLVSDLDGPKEILRNGKLGGLFTVGDSNDLAQKIISIYKNYSDAVKLTDKASKYCQMNFSIKNTTVNYINKY